MYMHVYIHSDTYTNTHMHTYMQSLKFYPDAESAAKGSGHTSEMNIRGCDVRSICDIYVHMHIFRWSVGEK